jgi:hypothetical protein
MGYTIDQELFVNGYVIVDKQQIKLNKVKELIFSKHNLGKVGGLSKDTLGRYTTQELRPTPNKYKPEASTLSGSRSIHGVTDVFVNSHELFVCVHPKTNVLTNWNNTGGLDVNKIINAMNSTEVILSIDINDFITCSEGGVSSCMSMNNSYHLGWMMHFRSDFSIMTFTHKKGDSFYKTGRSWTFVKLTEDGLPFSRPFYKLSKIYQALNKGHINIVDNYIQKQAMDILNMKKPSKRVSGTDYGSNKHIVSPNMRNTTSGTVQGTGYFDWAVDDTVPIWEFEGEFPVVPFSPSNYKKGPICLLNFPDALDVDGAPTNEGAFRNTPEHNHSAFFGWNERYKQFVKCKATGKRMLLRDVLELNDGTFIDKALAANIISGAPVAQVIEEVVVEEATPVTIEISDDEISDF